MKIALRFGICCTVALLALATKGLTINLPVNAEYVRDHPNEFNVTVKKGKNGLLDFKIIRIVLHPVYLVAHLSVHHQGRVIAESHTPAFTKNRENTIYFSLAPEDVAESTFELGESSFTENGDQAIPIVGTKNYQFQLKEFVPKGMLMEEGKAESDREGVTFPSLQVR